MNDHNEQSDFCIPAKFYKEILKKFDFAQPFMDDPNIFNSNSDTWRNFLIEAFAFIHPDFHSLSFLNKEIDQEIIRAAEILQILPIKAKKSDKLLDNFNDSEIKMFWNKLFGLLNCKRDYDFCRDVTTTHEKFGFLKDISKTLDYVHHELPIIKGKNISNEILNNEVENWNNLSIKCLCTQEDSLISHYDSHHVEQINIKELLMNLEQVNSMLKNAQFANKICKLEHEEFFNSFTLLTQDIIQSLINLKDINSSFLDELYYKMSSDTKFIHSSSLYFLKRCNNFFKTFEYKDKIST